MKFQAIAQIGDQATARVLLVALRAHGFHPLEPREGGLPGVPNLFGPEGFILEVPEEEAEDAGVLVGDLLKDMEKPVP
ncbi:hypothetical protein ACFOOL_01980 [Devosia honganensis]|uniref:DUF2007 domain-containing protein n=1 Tax=Devosia honganensis TaxID=1610527 RepID=A0ABV7WW41_9HYPH